MYVTICCNGNRQIPILATYVHSSNHTHVSLCVIACHCVSLRGIAFTSACGTHATRVFHVCHVELVADLYYIYVRTYRYAVLDIL